MYYDVQLFATMVVLMVEFAQILTLAGVHLIGGMDLPVNNVMFTIIIVASRSRAVAITLTIDSRKRKLRDFDWKR